MIKKANELEFISQILRDGSGTRPLSEDEEKYLLENQFRMDDGFKLSKLSIKHDTYIAVGFNSYVVKLKRMEEHPFRPFDDLGEKIDDLSPMRVLFDMAYGQFKTESEFQAMEVVGKKDNSWKITLITHSDDYVTLIISEDWQIQLTIVEEFIQVENLQINTFPLYKQLHEWGFIKF